MGKLKLRSPLGSVSMIPEDLAENNELTVPNVNDTVAVRSDAAVNVKHLGITDSVPGQTIAESISKSSEILAVLVADMGEVFIPSTIKYDAKTLFSDLPSGVVVVAYSDDMGLSYGSYRTKGVVQATRDTQQDDSAVLITSGHHAVCKLFNSQLDNTDGSGGQSTSSVEGKCSLTFQAGYYTWNGREIPNPSSRIQRWKDTSDVTHLQIQHPNQITEATRVMFDVTSNGNCSLGGTTATDDYNFLVYPSNNYTPYGDKATTLALRNVQPSGNGCHIEMVERDDTATSSMVMKYTGQDLFFLGEDSKDGLYTGALDQIVFEGDVSSGRGVASGGVASLKTYALDNKGIVYGVNNLTTGLTKSLIYASARSDTKSYNFIKMYDADLGTTPFLVSGTGDVTAAGDVTATGYFADGFAGATGSFTTADGKTVTVTGGIITGIVIP